MLSEKNWKPESVLRLVMSLLVCQGVTSLVFLLLRGGVDAKAAPSVARIVLSTACFQIVTVAMVWRFLREHQVDWKAGFGFRNHISRAAGTALLVIGLFLPVAWMLQFASLKVLVAFGYKPELQAAVKALLQSGSPAEFIGMGIITIVFAPIAEEMLFRGVLYPAVKQAGYPRAALWGTSILFAVIHLNAAIFIPLTVLALLLVWLYEKTDNLLAPIAAHATFNAVNFAMFFVAEDFVKKLPAQP